MAPKRSLDDAVQTAKHILLDIEGTITSISFVKDTLFPYVRKNLESYISANWEDSKLKEVIDLLRNQASDDKKAELNGVVEIPEEGSADDLKSAVVKNVLWQMDSDRKTTALKKLQGQIFSKGYKEGELKGHLYADVAPALQEWSKNGRKLYIYSSGSVEAQKLLFGNTTDGDLLELFSGFFDTEVGPKVEAESYKTILKKLNCSADDVLFLTDVAKEASAARQAGLPVVLVVREGNEPISADERQEYSSVSSFSDLEFEVSSKKKNIDSEEIEITDKTAEDVSEDKVENAEEKKAETNGRTEDVEMKEEDAESKDTETEIRNKAEATNKIDKTENAEASLKGGEAESMEVESSATAESTKKPEENEVTPETEKKEHDIKDKSKEGEAVENSDKTTKKIEDVVESKSKETDGEVEIIEEISNKEISESEKKPKESDKEQDVKVDEPSAESKTEVIEVETAEKDSKSVDEKASEVVKEITEELPPKSIEKEADDIKPVDSTEETKEVEIVDKPVENGTEAVNGVSNGALKEEAKTNGASEVESEPKLAKEEVADVPIAKSAPAVETPASESEVAVEA